MWMSCLFVCLCLNLWTFSFNSDTRVSSWTCRIIKCLARLINNKSKLILGQKRTSSFVSEVAADTGYQRSFITSISGYIDGLQIVYYVRSVG
jgi:hypothetical protein